MPKVSIIVPVFKVEQYIHRCIESLFAQTLTDIEIILVDDGSPDQCPDICDAYAAHDQRIKVVHKKNGGLSSARNAGMQVATGTYIGFVDSDDTVAPDMYEKLFSIMETEKVDFVMCDYIRVPSTGSSYLKTLDIRAGHYTKQDIRTDIFPNLIMGKYLDYGPLLSVWHCLYRSEFLSRNQLLFDEEVRWSEDNIFSAFVGYHANSFYYLKGEGLYHYYQNPGTITTTYRPGAWDVYCTMNRHLHSFFSTVSDYDFSRQLKLHMIYYACNCIGQSLSLKPLESVSVIKTILCDEHLRNAFSNFQFPNTHRNLKIQLLFMKYKLPLLLYYFKR